MSAHTTTRRAERGDLPESLQGYYDSLDEAGKEAFLDAYPQIRVDPEKLRREREEAQRKAKEIGERIDDYRAVVAAIGERIDALSSLKADLESGARKAEGVSLKDELSPKKLRGHFALAFPWPEETKRRAAQKRAETRRKPKGTEQ